MTGFTKAQLMAELQRLRLAGAGHVMGVPEHLLVGRTVFVRCGCGRVREAGIICPTNQEGGHCEDGA
jgi:hypothetical protein